MRISPDTFYYILHKIQHFLKKTINFQKMHYTGRKVNCYIEVLQTKLSFLTSNTVNNLDIFLIISKHVVFFLF